MKTYQNVTAQKRAKDLFDKFAVQDFNPNSGWHILESETVDQCKTIVDEFISVYNWPSGELSYWNEVKSELSKLLAKDGMKEGG